MTVHAWEIIGVAAAVGKDTSTAAADIDLGIGLINWDLLEHQDSPRSSSGK